MTLRSAQLPQPTGEVAVVLALVLLQQVSAVLVAASVLKVQLHPQQVLMVAVGAVVAVALLLVSVP